MNQPDIICKGVSKYFGEGKAAALENVDLAIPSGSIFGIIGLSGAGKSTLVRCFCGLDKPSSGTILLGGKDVSQLDAKGWRRVREQLGFVFQHFNLFSSRTALENICYPLEVHGMAKSKREARALELLALVGLLEKKEAYPSQLSGGEKQRIGIARALALEPKLLLCDEATSALDVSTGRSLLTLIKNLNKMLGLTVVMITHQVEAVKQICTHLAVMEKGTIVEHGSCLALCLNPQHTITRALLGWKSALSGISLERRKPGSLIHLSFSANSSCRPLISQAAKKFEIEINILGGKLEEVAAVLIGNLLVEISGEDEEVKKSLDFLVEQGVGCEVIV